MYTELIQKIISAINAGRTDIVQMYLSNLLMTERCEVNEDAKKELVAAIPGSKVVFGDGIGLRVGYFFVNGERYYFA